MGCATTYAPRETGRIHFLTSGKGEEVIEKDGKKYSMDIFSGELVDAVSGNPAAEEHARTSVRRQRIGGGLAILAGLSVLAGYVTIAMTLTADPRRIDRRTTAIAGFSMLFGGVACGIGAGIMAATGEGHFYDAVNIYNDDVWRSRSRFPVGERGMTLPGVAPLGR
jgi:hypothetical protein